MNSKDVGVNFIPNNTINLNSRAPETALTALTAKEDINVNGASTAPKGNVKGA